MEPKTRTKIGPKPGPKMQSGPQICTETQTRTCRDDLHSAVCWAILFNCATNEQLQPKKEGKLWAGKIAQTESMNAFTDQT